jgi:AraC-like DNA-binding protein
VHGVRIALTCQIRRYIDEHLCSDDLTPESLAAHFRLSRATLYRLFVDEGGVRHLIRRHRLARARLGLVSPAQRHWTIAQIGVQAGYAHAQDFIRAYRREFDITPGDERELARAAGRMWRSGRASPRPLWADWVHRIGP